MSLKEHTAVKLEHRGQLTKIGQIVAESLNNMAAFHERGEPLPNHTPTSPAYWFSGLARENATPPFGQFANPSPIESPVMRAALSDAAVALARQVLACRCDERWGSWESGERWGDDPLEDGHPFVCYACASDAHGMCSFGCNANQDVLVALDEELASRGLPAYERPVFDALQKELAA